MIIAYKICTKQIISKNDRSCWESMCLFIVEGGNISATFREDFFMKQSLILVIEIPDVQFLGDN